MSEEEMQSSEQDRAVAARLAKLSAMPVDLSRLDRLVQAQIPRETSVRRTQWFRPLRMAIAASLMLLIGIAAFFIGTSGGPVEASTSDMAKFHDDLVSGRVQAMHVATMDEANKALAAQWAESPGMPNVPNDHVMACCMRSVKNKKMACVLLKGSGEPVTMTVANAADMQSPTSPMQARNGMEYHVQATGTLNMVMTQRQGRWVCLIARLPVERLMDLASSLEF
jgi:hypothetical protein